MGFSFEIDTPANGQLHKSTVTVLDDAGDVVTTDRLNLADLTDRKRCAQRLGKKLRRKVATVEKQLEATVRKVQTERRATEKQKKDVRPGDAVGEKKQSAASHLANLVTQEAELFHTPDHQTYATLIVEGHRETWGLRSGAFRRWLSRRYHTQTGQAPGAQAVADAQAVLEGKALFEGPCVACHCRLAEHAGNIYLDLGDSAWRAVEVTAEGWRVLSPPPVKFRRPRGLLPLPTPTQGGRLETLREFLNLSGEDDWRLLAAWLIQATRPRGPYPVLCLHGEQGSAKSTAAKVVRRLLDPSEAPLRSAPRDERDLVIAASNGWVVSLDNLSHLPDWLSDALCRLATGGGFATRELYSDTEEVIFSATRPAVLNGIEDLVTRGDLLDRSLILRLASIPESKRQPEREFWSRFEAAHPCLLGALLDAVSGAMRELPHVRLKSSPRLADFAEWSIAAGTALGWNPGDFLAAYRGNRADANQLAIDASPLAAPLIQFVNDRRIWSGTAQELLDALTLLAGQTVARAKEWPKKPHTLSGRLRRLAPSLRGIGISVEFERLANRGRQRQISISQQENYRNGASEASEASENSQNPSKTESCVGRSQATSDASGRCAGRSEGEKTPEMDASDAVDASLQDFSCDGEIVTPFD